VSARKAIVSALVLASLGAAALFAFARSGPRSPAARGEPSFEAAGEANVATADRDEVRRLRAEVKAKDGVIRALTNQAMASDTERAAAAAATTAALKRTSITRAIEVLDARLAAAPADAAAKAELERALQPALESKALAAAHVDDLRCAGTLCKIALSAATAAELAPAMEAVATHAPKSFPSMIAYPEGDSARAIFVGRTSADLTIDGPAVGPDGGAK
jgi:hypothetical protein